MKTVVLFGDSMLGRFTKSRIDQFEDEAVTEIVVINCGAGGWTCRDGARRVEMVARMAPDVVVLSFGMNDCAPERLVGLDAFGAYLRSIVEAFPRATVLGFLPPSVIEQDGVGPRGRTNTVLASYRDVLRDVVDLGRAVETDEVLAPLVAAGVPTHVDGIHLTDEAYRLVIRALARLVDAS
ncbi:SGNH/GDSL hydrolase family protein [Streptomyces sp. NBC_01497]|uniref:SGNH/GDSL hydrolase family protein n=1 Tax=Streptomyces sp. NBC_01497 TaxID=2903885 RepID=UPI002E3427AC|nr:SGNH/GDSL hydrolase family protein [Streptomyces sp. NBC_01497]